MSSTETDTAILALPELHWGDPDSPQHALLLHGLSSMAGSNWRLGEALAAAGWFAVAADLRGHGHAGRSAHYRFDDYAGDVLALRPERVWDAVIGHSLGSVTTVRATTREPGWAKRLVLLDPAFYLTDKGRQRLLLTQRAALADPRAERFRAEHPLWHERDIQSRVEALQLLDPVVGALTIEQNDPWNVLEDVERLRLPTLILGSDPEVGTLFTVKQEQRLRGANPGLQLQRIAQSSHAIHRDQGPAVVEAVLAFLEES